ncbi:MAG: PadR family transcriptional regulator [Sulfolobaceae archaeon]|nr:PadR family transcriptional regulator [Sulfolobaceae archaeon]
MKEEKRRFSVIGGLLPVLVAYLLYRYGDMYGYEIKKRIEERYPKKLPQGMIYVVLKRLTNSGIILSYEKDGKKYYKLTENGKEFLVYHLIVLSNAKSIIEEILNYFSEEGSKSHNS